MGLGVKGGKEGVRREEGGEKAELTAVPHRKRKGLVGLGVVYTSHRGDRWIA